MTRFSVTVCGDVVRECHLHLRGPLIADGYAEIDSLLSSLGGAGAFAALVLAELGATVDLLAPRGSDRVGAVYGQTLAERGIRWTATTELAATPSFLSLYGPDGARYVVHDALPVRGVTTELPQSDMLLLYPCATDVGLSLAQQAFERRAHIVFAPSHTLFGLRDYFVRIAGMASWVVLNRYEASMYGLAQLPRMSNAVISDGATGATVVCDGAEEFVATRAVTSYSDAGTGDVLAALFSALCLGVSRPPAAALAAAQSGVGEFLRGGHMPLEHADRLRGLRRATEWE